MDRPWFVYILECGDGSLYTGITDDLQRRLEKHQKGEGAKYTRGRGPLKIVYTECVANHSLALRREFAIKRLPRSQKLMLIQKEK